MQAWKKLSQSEQKLGYKWLTSKVYASPTGDEQQFTIWGRSGTHNVAVIAMTEDNQVVVARQFRQGPELVFDEIPGGAAENDEELQVAAARELREETGFTTDQPFVYLGIAYRDAYSNEQSTYYLALGCRQTTSQQLDDHEFVDIAFITIEQLISNAKTGRMTDVAAVLMAYEELLKIQNQQS